MPYSSVLKLRVVKEWFFSKWFLAKDPETVMILGKMQKNCMNQCNGLNPITFPKKDFYI